MLFKNLPVKVYSAVQNACYNVYMFPVLWGEGEPCLNGNASYVYLSIRINSKCLREKLSLFRSLEFRTLLLEFRTLMRELKIPIRFSRLDTLVVINLKEVGAYTK